MRNVLKYLGLGLMLVLGLTALGRALPPTEVKTWPLAWGFDLDGEAADDDQVMTAQVLADSTDYTASKAADPDVCRLVDITIADTGISAGTITVTGTDCWGDPLVATWSGFTAGDDDGVKTLTVGTPDLTARKNLAGGAYFKTVTKIETNALTGETGAETVKVGYTTNCPVQAPLYGVRSEIPSLPYRLVDIRGMTERNVAIRGAASPTVSLTAATAGTNPFQSVVVGDLVGINVQGARVPVQWRKITARADADNITVDRAVTITTDAAGQGFYYKKFFLSSDPQDGWFMTEGLDGAMVVVDVQANADTGGVVTDVRCMSDLGFAAVQLDTDTVASGSAGAPSTSIDFRLAPFALCRAGVKFGTGDDADAAVENIYVTLSTSR